MYSIFKFCESYGVISIKTVFYITRTVKTATRKLLKGEVVQVVGMSFCDGEQSYLVEVLKTGERLILQDFTFYSSSSEFEVPLNASVSEIYSMVDVLVKKDDKVWALECVLVAALFIIAVGLHHFFIS